ncbi:hypothetical protein ACNVED_15310 (plasmid) [Legionella sp. D16C41]|uniref:hypothetical protein n=1 Tax=Legionella sp. D16C41 TaxID=3402688 RepID=UPI003AF77D8D
MSTYFDPIMQKETELDNNTIAYLVKISDDKFSIKAISSGLDQLPSDPTTHATTYWPIAINSLLTPASQNVFFRDNKLITQAISKEDVIKFFEFDPDNVPPAQFNASIKEDLINNWANEVMQDELSHASQNINLFFRPILIQRHSENNPTQQDNVSPTSDSSHMLLIPLAVILSNSNIQEQIAAIIPIMFSAIFEMSEETELENESDMMFNQGRPA